MSRHPRGRALRAGLIASLLLSLGGLWQSVPVSQAASPSITATKTASFPSHPSGKAQPGDTVTYTVTLKNAAGAGDATGLTFTDTPDANTTLVPSSVTSTPIAQNDSYSAIGNVRIHPTAAAGVLANDTSPTGDTLTVSNPGSVTASQGSLALAADGSFTYTSNAGFSGTDSFTYTISDSHGHTDTATASISVSAPIWFIDSSAASNGDGRLSTPFNSLTGFMAVNNGTSGHPAAGDTIFLATGSGSYTGGVTLLSNQRLIGQGASASLASILGITVPSYSDPLPSTGGTNPTITNAGGNDLSLTAGSTGNTVRGMTLGASSSTGFAISGTSFGTLTLSDLTINNTAGGGLSLTTGTLSATIASLTAAGGPNGLALSGVSGTLTINGGSLSGASGTEVSISGSNPTVSDSGTVSKTNNAASAVAVNGTTGGTMTFSGAITANTSTATAINLTTNTGATITLSGGLNLTTTSGTGFNATGGGTVTAAQNNTTIVNTISSTTGTAVDVANTTIGASGLTFRSISAAGAVNGIVLTNTGSSGGVTVSGNGTAGTGGTIQSSTGPGILLTSTKSPSFSWMIVKNGSNDGIDGSNVAGFALDHSTVSGNGSAVGQRGLKFGDRTSNITGITGTASITNSTISNPAEDGAMIRNGAGSTLNLTVSNTTFTGTSASVGNDGLLVESDDSANITMVVSGSTFSGNRGDHVQFTTNTTATGTNNVTISGNTMTDDRGSTFGGYTLGGCITVNPGGSGYTKLLVTGNTITGAVDSAVRLNPGLAAGGRLDATVSSNTIGTAALTDSGSAQANGILVWTTGSGTTNALVHANQVRQYANVGIYLLAGEGNAVQNSTVTGNTVANPDPVNALNGLRAEAGTLSTDTVVLCADVGGTGTAANSATGSGGTGLTDIRARLGSTANVAMKLPGYTGGSTDTTAVGTYLTNRNNGASANASDSVSAPFQNGGAGCAQPAAPSTPTTSTLSTQSAPEAGPAASHSPSYAPLVASVRTTILEQAHGSVSTRGRTRHALRILHPDTVTINGNTVTVTAGTLPAGKSVTLTFQVTISSSITAGSISNQGTVSGTNFSTVLTDDPSTPTPNDPTVTQVVIPTTTSVTSSKNPSTFGDSVTFTATVSPGAGTSTPTGTVQFQDGGSNLGSPQTLAGGVATLVTSALSAGSHTITAVYGGQGAFQTSTGSLTGNPQVVTKASTTTSLASSANPSVVGQAVKFTATIGAPAAALAVAPPTGSVDFSEGATKLGSGTLGTSSGVTTATFTTSGLSVGNHTVTATYNADTNYTGSSASAGQAVTQTVNKAGTSTSLTADHNPSAFGQSVTFTASVSVTAPGAGTLTGTVQFQDNGSNLGSPQTVANGTATLTTAALSAGSHPITAVYSGDTNFATSTSSPFTQQVNKASTSTAITAHTPNPSNSGQAVTVNYSVTVSSPGAGTPTGNVKVTDGVDSCTGSVTAGSCTISLTTSGTRTLTASYQGDGNFAASTSSGVSQTVNVLTSTVAGAAGWNLVGGSPLAYFSDAVAGSGWSWSASTGSWTQITSANAGSQPHGAGAWEELAAANSNESIQVQACSSAVTVSVFPHRWNMVGNPCSTAVTLPSGARALLYQNGQYVVSGTIPAGLAAWVLPGSASLSLTPS